MPSTSLIGGVHTPPISPRVWKPAAGYSPSAVPMAYARSPTTKERRSGSRVVSLSSGLVASVERGSAPPGVPDGLPTACTPREVVPSRRAVAARTAGGLGIRDMALLTGMRQGCDLHYT